MFFSDIFRANDIRGRYNKDFDLSFITDLSFALCRLAKQKDMKSPRFLIGHDARLSSPEISQALIQQLKQQGGHVTFIGLAPSPLCYFLLYHYNLTACIVVTASHNPPKDNGFKILFHKKYKIFEPIQILRHILHTQNSPKKAFKQKGEQFEIQKKEPYILSLKREFSFKCPFPFAVDTGNGALGPLAKKVFSALNLQAEYLYDKPDGHFPNHHPDPTVEDNLLDIKTKIQKEQLELGLAFDGDGDRLTLVTKEKKMVLGDELAYLFLKSIKKSSKEKNKSSIILADVKCSNWFFSAAKKEGLNILMTKSGHGLMRQQMEKTGALFALELSGHIFFNDRKDRGFDDALYAGLRVLELLSLQTTNLISVLPKFPGVRTGEIRIPLPHSEILKKLSAIQGYLQQKGESFQDIDGIRISRPTSWALFRASKTQEILSMRFEALNIKQLQQLKEEFSQIMKLSIP